MKDIDCKKQFSDNDIIWISWEDHRRSRELSSHLGAVLVFMDIKGSRLKRYMALMPKTLFVILKNRPRIIICQNPSIVLAALLALIKDIFKFNLVVDRHTNFKFHKIGSKNIKWKIFFVLSDYSLRRADLTVVTNEALKEIVESKGGRSVVLQDKLPDLSCAANISLKGSKNVLVISTFSDDEPIEEIVDASSRFGLDTCFYITGNYYKYPEIESILKRLPENIILTGFVDEHRYQSLLFSSDLVMILTNQEYTLNCGSYEAVQLEKPMILSDTETIKEYFNKGAVYVKSDQNSIYRGLKQGLNDIVRLRKEVSILKGRLRKDWVAKVNLLQAQLDQFKDT